MPSLEILMVDSEGHPCPDVRERFHGDPPRWVMATERSWRNRNFPAVGLEDGALVLMPCHGLPVAVLLLEA